MTDLDGQEREALLAAFLHGFGRSAEGFNSEYPFDGDWKEMAASEILASSFSEFLAAREDTERPDGDSHWATVVIEPESFEPRELTEAESVELDESGLGIAVDRMWIRPGVWDPEQEPRP